jgi:hypothetical protein
MKNFFVWRELKAEFRSRVARWYFFKPKIPNLVNFGGPWRGKGWYRLEYISAIWYILWPFGNVVEKWYILRCFGKLCQKIWQPCFAAQFGNFKTTKKLVAWSRVRISVVFSRENLEAWSYTIPGSSVTRWAFRRNRPKCSKIHFLPKLIL